MHEIQVKILNFLKSQNGTFKNFSFRALGDEIHIKHPQRVKHHVLQLERRGLLRIDSTSKILRLVSLGSPKESAIATIPIVGAANCGPTTLYAQENIEGTLKISKKLISNKEKKIFAIRAVGSSMNRANVNGLSIEEGDYVIIDGNTFTPQNGDYVLAVIDEFGLIKKFVRAATKNEIELLSESSEEHPSIHIHSEDQQIIINGRVIYVVKKQRTN